MLDSAEIPIKSVERVDRLICVKYREINIRSSREALDNGVAMVHQELNQVKIYPLKAIAST